MIFQSCQNVGKKFSLRFFSAGGNRRKCGDSFSLAKMSAKSFRCAIFQLAGTGGNVWTSLAWNDTYECQLGLQIPDFNFQLHSEHESPIRQVRK